MARVTYKEKNNMSNEYLRKALILDIENVLKLAKEGCTEYKENNQNSRRDRILFAQGKNTIERFFEQYFKEKEQTNLSRTKAEYVTKRIIIAAKEGQVKTLQQTYREYKEENKKKIDTAEKERLDEIMYFCPKMIKSTKEALEVIYKDIDKYYERAMKEK